MDAKDEIKARLPIDQLVAQYCQLKRKGRNFVAVCPFHNDTNPSMLVSPDKGIAYCFACQSGGDIFSFVQKIEGVDFPGALKILAEKAGVELPKLSRTGKVSVTKDEKIRLRECLEAAQAFYVSKIKAVPSALAYVQGRGVTPELMQQFGIGYAPDSFSETYDALLKSGFSRGEIVKAGLGVQKELTDERIYDRFRHRTMFPITDSQGQIVGFGGRAMGESDAKYVNSPEGVLYNKSAVLFGLSHAKEAIRTARSVVLVEGYFDAIASWKAGVKNVVAVSGTALTEEHVRTLRRYAETVILCLDQDSAGQLAASRAFGLLAKAAMTIQSVTLPAKDPDELVQRDAALFAHLITKTAAPYLDTVIDRLRERTDIAEPTGKRAVSETLFPLIVSLPTSVELRAYLDKAAAAFGIVASELEADFRAWRAANERRGPAAAKRDLTESLYSRDELLLGLACVYPALRPLLAELIPFEADGPEAVRKAFSVAPTDGKILEVLAPLNLEPQLVERLTVVALYAEETFPAWSEAFAIREFRKLCASANREVTIRRQMEIVAKLKDARSRGRKDEEAMLLTQYDKLLKLTRMAG